MSSFWLNRTQPYAAWTNRESLTTTSQQTDYITETRYDWHSFYDYPPVGDPSPTIILEKAKFKGTGYIKSIEFDWRASLSNDVAFYKGATEESTATDKVNNRAASLEPRSPSIRGDHLSSEYRTVAACCAARSCAAWSLLAL